MITNDLPPAPPIPGGAFSCAVEWAGMDQNPYESPREPQPTIGKVKRGLGVGAILLLTPVAIAIAFFTSCTALSAYMNATFHGVEGSTKGWVNAWVFSAWVVFLLPPLATLTGMIWWAVRAYHRSKRDRPVT